MKKFNIIRYLKRWWPLIALMSIFAGAFFMRYATNHQAYTAQAVIKYTYDAASEGLTPNGEPLDVSEIFSSTVVKEAIERLGYSVNVDTIRSGGTVTGITPADVQTRQDALAEKGEEVEEYYPTEYVVKLTVGSSRSAEFARLMLDEILSCYFASFGEKYADRVMAVMPMWSIILVVAGIFVFAILGGLLGKTLLKKHFAKAGIA